MIRWLKLWWFRQTLLERSARYQSGYDWAMRELHAGQRLAPMPELGRAFMCGMYDACYDWGTRIHADSIWDRRSEELERTQPLPRMEQRL
jgi:hypothetical protein